MINFIGLYILLVFVLAGITSRKNIALVLRDFDNSSGLTRLIAALCLGWLSFLDIHDLFSNTPPIPGWTGFMLSLPKLFISNGVLIWVHEGGHAALSWAGEFVHILGGTLFQIGLPVLLTLLCYRKKFYVATALGLWIVGTSFIMCVPYIWDASERALPLLGMSGTQGHDWGNMLTTLKILGHEKALGYVFLSVGVLFEVVGIVGVWISDNQDANGY